MTPESEANKALTRIILRLPAEENDSLGRQDALDYKTIRAALTRLSELEPIIQELVEARKKGVWAPKEIEGASYILVGDFRLCNDPSVPTEMILFPDDETRQWFCDRLRENDELDDAAHNKTMDIIALQKTIKQLLDALNDLLMIDWRPINETGLSHAQRKAAAIKRAQSAIHAANRIAKIGETK